jgi:hypothetical protein
MNRQQFQQALDRHGGDLARWPLPLGEDARRFVAGDDEAARQLREALRLEMLMADAFRPLPMDEALVGRIVSGARGEKRVNGIQLRPTRRLVALASMATALALVIGFTAGYFDAPDDSEDAIASLVFGATDVDAGDWL